MYAHVGGEVVRFECQTTRRQLRGGSPRGPAAATSPQRPFRGVEAGSRKNEVRRSGLQCLPAGDEPDHQEHTAQQQGLPPR